MERPIYLDYAATTPVCLPALEAMFKCLGPKAEFGNPHSTTHEYGVHASEIVDQATKNFANLIGAAPNEIVWTSGATESNNLAIQGAAHFYASKGKHLITTQIEHHAVLDVYRALEKEGFEVTYLPVQRRGLVDLKVLEAALRPDTTLVSVIAVHNELGSIQPLHDIATIVKQHGAFLHIDAAQALGKIPLDFRKLPIDLASFSGHKIYAPKGIGALYMRLSPRVRLKPLFFGGSQQRGIRPGTLSPALISAFTQGAEFACQNPQTENQRIAQLRDLFLKELADLPGIKLNNDPLHSVPHILNLRFTKAEPEVFFAELKDKIAVAKGSACTSMTMEPSHVLRAIGLNSLEADQSIRFSFGAYTTEDDIKNTAKIIRAASYTNPSANTS